MKSYVINLDRSPDRWQRMADRLNSIGAAFERVPAVDGRLLSDTEISDVHKPVAGAAAMTPEEVGCFLSHRKCWERIVSGPDAYGCVFEDDMLISKQAALFLGEDPCWIPADADIIKIEAVPGRVWLDRVISPLPGIFKLALLRSFLWGSGGYILSKVGGRAPLSAHKSILGRGRPCEVQPRLWNSPQSEILSSDPSPLRSDTGLLSERIQFDRRSGARSAQ